MVDFYPLLSCLLGFVIAVAEQFLYTLPSPLQNLWWDVYFFLEMDIYEAWAPAFREEPIENLLMIAGWIILSTLLWRWLKDHLRREAELMTSVAAQRERLTLGRSDDGAEEGLFQNCSTPTGPVEQSTAHLSSAPSESPSCNSPVYIPAPFPYQNFNGTGDSFQMHIYYGRKQERPSTYLQPDEVYKEELSHRQVPSKRNDLRRDFEEPTTLEAPTVPTTVVGSEAPQKAIEAPPQIEEKTVIAAPFSEILEAPVTTVSTYTPPPAPIQEPLTKSVVLSTQASETMRPSPSSHPPPPPPPPPSKEQLCMMLFARLRDESGHLMLAMQAFIMAFESSNDGQGAEAMALICQILRDAHAALLGFFPCGMILDHSSHIGWNDIVMIFWERLRPKGHWIYYHGDQSLHQFLEGVHGFGQYLGLQLQDLDMTPPPQALPDVPLPFAISSGPPPALAETPLQTTLSEALSQPEATQSPVLQSNQLPPTIVEDLLAPAKPVQMSLHEALKAVSPTQDQNGWTAEAEQSMLDLLNSSIDAEAHEEPQVDGPMPKRISGSEFSGDEDIAPLTSWEVPKADIPATSASASVAATDFDDLSGWKFMVYKVLKELDWDSFGCADKTQMMQRLWQFSAAQDFVFAAPGLGQTRDKYVRQELINKAGAFKRAAVVLRIQLMIGNRRKYCTSAPPLLNEMHEFFKQASAMTDACNMKKFPVVLEDAVRFWHNKVARKPEYRERMLVHYPEQAPDAFLKQWEEVNKKWGLTDKN